MADQDQDKKTNATATIDDLVKQLSNQKDPKPSPGLDSSPSQTRSQPSSARSQQPPPNLPGVKIPPPKSFTAGKNPFAAKQTPTVEQVKPTTTPPSAGLPAQAGGLKPSPIKEYKSSIRTMNEDISSIKLGKKPLGTDISRKIGHDQSKKVGVETNKTDPSKLPSAGGPRPSVVGLGGTKRTGPLASLPTSPTSTDKKPEPPKPPGIQPPVIVPGGKKGLSTTFYLLIAGVLVVGGFMYWFFVLRTPDIVPVTIPTPTRTITPTPTVRNLDQIFEGSPVNFEILLNESVGSDFKTFANTLNVASTEFLEVSLLQDVGGTLLPLNFLEMFDLDLTIYPSGLKNDVVDSAVLVYGQSESFNVDGTINLDAQGLIRTVFVARIKDKSGVEAMMKDWELTIADDLADYLLINDTANEASVNFLPNLYRGVSIRYKNFPFPDVTVDYSIVDSNGQSYLVISGSREATFATIDVLLNQ